MEGEVDILWRALWTRHDERRWLLQLAKMVFASKAKAFVAATSTMLDDAATASAVRPAQAAFDGQFRAVGFVADRATAMGPAAAESLRLARAAF